MEAVVRLGRLPVPPETPESHAVHILRLRKHEREIADPRLRVVHGSAADARRLLKDMQLERADYIISGIPYTTLPDAVRRQVVNDSHDLLHPEGALVFYQFTGAARRYLASAFGNVEEDFNLLNILPARIFYCTP